MEKTIKALDISLVDISKRGENRSFTIRGTSGASFILQVVNSAGQFYNFNSRVFAVGSHIPENNFKGTIVSNKVSSKIRFPAVVATTVYNVIVIAKQGTGTTVTKNGGVINKSLNQVLDTTISFRLLSDTSPTSYLTLPSAATAVASPTNVGGQTISIAHTASNTQTTNGFGLILSRQPVETDVVFRNTQTVDGTISGVTTVVLDSVVDLAVGTFVVGVSSGSLSGTPSIKKIDTATKTIVLSAAQSFGDGITLTFEARGFKSIYNAIGVILEKPKFDALAPLDSIVTKTVRTASSASTTINLNGTFGIAGGGIVTYSGAGVDSSTANAVTSVSASEDAGSIVVGKAQTLALRTKLTFKGCNSKIDIFGKFKVSKFGNTDRTINLLLDNFITPGAAS